MTRSPSIRLNPPPLRALPILPTLKSHLRSALYGVLNPANAMKVVAYGKPPAAIHPSATRDDEPIELDAENMLCYTFVA